MSARTAPSNVTTRCPFDIIVITSPDAAAARAVRNLILSSCGQFPSNYLGHHNDDNNDDSNILQSSDGTIFISSCDSFGARLGSGGGTIAALAEADDVYQNWDRVMQNICKEDKQSSTPTVLICHAGGESSRCPTQIALGKAWTSLPVVQREKNMSRSYFTTKVSNPTSLLIATLNRLFADVPSGSVVVAASDVLLSFDGGTKINFGVTEEERRSNNRRVFGLAVPAPLETAKNHGVFVLESAANAMRCNNNDEELDWTIQPTFRVLQKPSVDEMKSATNPECTFNRTNVNGSAELMAWIDTGVVTFLPEAADTLRELSRTLLKPCTRRGLDDMYRGETSDKGKRDNKRQKVQTIEEFAQITAPKVCLYSDILHAMRTSSATPAPSGSDLLSLLHNALCDTELYTCAIANGGFLHLGTTGELLDFLTIGTPRAEHDSMQQRICSVGKSTGLTHQADSYLTGFTTDSKHTSTVINTKIDTRGLGSAIGEGSVVEHCELDCTDACVVIGDRCLVSGLRRRIKGPSLRIPSGLCLQLLPLTSDHENFVCLCFGVDDCIKGTPDSLFGLNLKRVLEVSGLNESDLWDDSIPVSKRMIWNAKTNPIVCEDAERKLDYSFLNWINALIEVCRSESTSQSESELTSEALVGLKQWKESHRMSISQLRQRVDSASETSFRSSITARNHTLTTTKPVTLGNVVVASAPARIDLSGGWSDTPPISFEHGGAVACLAVMVEGKRPLRAQCRMVKGTASILLRTESRRLGDEELESSSEVLVQTLADLADLRDPLAECSLLKCALVYLGLVKLDELYVDPSQSIQPYLHRFCQLDASDADIGLEIVSCSLLPTGSGMGSSSILGGCVLSAVARCIGNSSFENREQLVHGVLMLEQLLTTGGGWQDQIGGLVGGLKLGTSEGNVFPLRTKVKSIKLSPSVIAELNQRLVLAFTGKPRLAKNILQNVLRRWALRGEDIVTTVKQLVSGASAAIASLEEGDLNGLGHCMSEYWRQKKIMAGEGSGAEPDFVKVVLEHLTSKGDIVGGTLCGAGGGGFLAMLAAEGKTAVDIKASIETTAIDEVNLFSWHSCTVDNNGLIVNVINSE
ncbi:predicted protein [Thalassiosira pseudonana CCMP1335]|uniref:Fucokinase n=1 Tax=Thalassiosira pseudonana TaxID=35128 RepID=B8LDB3_THAPS|nr:predicted protein [Thalassiosira pseudonana CCMP1335]EED86683.1 predicted protein [Thalassiosira pseudonana CCMP1335]|eukprot:scaffold4733_cov170-Alexandrium_tamarense.AAC.50